MSGSKCPICLSITNRLVKEDCGHSKCRNCFIQEANGCRECSRENSSERIEVCTKEKSADQCWNEDGSRIGHSRHQNVSILEDITIRSETKTLPESSRQGTRKTIPSHIIQLRTGEEISYKCTVCDRVFRSRSQQYYHLYCNEVLKKPYFCKICSKHFSSLNHFKYHEETHKDNPTYKCGRCSKVFSREITLRKHIRNHDRNSRYSCNDCKATFKDKLAYRAHCDKHKNIYPFSCDQCDKRFCLKSTYKQHQLVHCDNSFECTYCKKCFKRKSSYRAHIVQHSESQRKQICCETCEKIFTSVKAFHRHKRIHDGSSFFKCTFCGVKCKRRDNLARHVKNMHPKEKQDSVEEVSFTPENNLSIEQDVQPFEDSSILPPDSSIQVQENQTILNDFCASTDTLGEIDHLVRHQQPRISQKCSVIKSIGNVKPVVLLQNSKTNKTEIMDTQTDAKKSNVVALIKKPKKKYDPREIYRKILFASNEEDSLIDETDVSTASEDTHLEDETKNKELCKTATQLNFAEVHWRKRTSQYFSSINVT